MVTIPKPRQAIDGTLLPWSGTVPAFGDIPFDTPTWCVKPNSSVSDARSLSGAMVRLPQLEIVDHVRIPSTLPAGDYVLGWRWDCEESTQIWTSCADVEVRSIPVEFPDEYRI